MESNILWLDISFNSFEQIIQFWIRASESYREMYGFVYRSSTTLYYSYNKCTCCLKSNRTFVLGRKNLNNSSICRNITITEQVMIFFSSCFAISINTRILLRVPFREIFNSVYRYL